MKKLNKEMLKEQIELGQKLESERGNLIEALDQFNAAMDKARADAETALIAYNNVLSEARSWTECVASEIDGYISEKSDKWQEGDRGQEYAAWKEAFENAELEDVEIELPDPVDYDDLEEHFQIVYDLPEEP